MKLNNVRPRQVLMATVVILVAFYIIKMMKKPGSPSSRRKFDSGRPE